MARRMVVGVVHSGGDVPLGLHAATRTPGTSGVQLPLSSVESVYRPLVGKVNYYHDCGCAAPEDQRYRCTLEPEHISLPVGLPGYHLNPELRCGAVGWALGASKTQRMRQLQSAAPDQSGQVNLPTVIEELLVDVATDGFTLYCCGPKLAPNALVAAYEWEAHVDIITIRDFDRVITARVPKRDVVDVFAPEVVVWAYQGPSQQALRALLDLVHPAHPDAPTAEYRAPVGLHVPRAEQRPMRVLLPAPRRARVRADRLSIAMRGGRA